MGAYQMLKTLDKKVNPKHTAVVVVDVQNDFCARGGWWDQVGEKSGVSMGEKMIGNLLTLINEARKASVMVVFIQAIYDEQFQSLPMKEHFARRLHSDLPCKLGTWGADFYRVKPLDGEIIVQKHRWSGFADTELDLVLRNRGIQTLIVTGVATNVCVCTTAHDGFFHDYYIVMPEDCTASFNPELTKAALWVIDRSFGEVPKSDQIIAFWKAQSKKTKHQLAPKPSKID